MFVLYKNEIQIIGKLYVEKFPEDIHSGQSGADFVVETSFGEINVFSRHSFDVLQTTEDCNFA